MKSKKKTGRLVRGTVFALGFLLSVALLFLPVMAEAESVDSVDSVDAEKIQSEDAEAGEILTVGALETATEGSESETEPEGDGGAPLAVKMMVISFFVGMFAMVAWTGFTFLRRFDDYAEIAMVFGRRRKR
jgi:hypothetical protein